MKCTNAELQRLMRLYGVTDLVGVVYAQETRILELHARLNQASSIQHHMEVTSCIAQHTKIDIAIWGLVLGIFLSGVALGYIYTKY